MKKLRLKLQITHYGIMEEEAVFCSLPPNLNIDMGMMSDMDMTMCLLLAEDKCCMIQVVALSIGLDSPQPQLLCVNSLHVL